MSEPNAVIPAASQNHVASNSLIRVDRNLALNSIAWFNQFGKEANICLDIILYLSHNYQRDLFNYGLIDLKDFCKKTGYDKANLQKLVNPLQKSVLPLNFDSLPRDQKYITAFENALYLLGHHNIPYSYTTFDTATNTKVLSTKFIQILKEIKIHIPGGTSRSKTYYTFKTSEDFDLNLSRLFFWSDFSQLPELRNKKLRLLYFYLKSIENSGFATFTENNFSKLCLLAGITLPDAQDPLYREKVKDAKYNLKRRKFTLLKKYIDFDFKDVVVSGKYKFGFEYTFNSNIAKLNILKTDPQAFKESNIHTLQKASSDYIMVRLIEYFRSVHKEIPSSQPLDVPLFRSWFLDSGIDIDIKQSIYFKSKSILENIPIDKAEKYAYAFTEFFGSFPEFYFEPHD